MKISNTLGIIVVAIPTILLGVWVGWEFVRTYATLHRRQQEINPDNDSSSDAGSNESGSTS